MNEAFSLLTPTARKHLRALVESSEAHGDANARLAAHCGVQEFFEDDEQLASCRQALAPRRQVQENGARREYGDYQTPLALAEKACARLAATEEGAIEHVVEPTFGKGAFLVAALEAFEELKTLCGVEIHAPYVWHTKFALFQFFDDHPDRERPTIRLHCANVYDFDFEEWAETLGGPVAVVGNPPWVTNAELGTLGSDNLPEKHNFKQHSGLDALTGKSNFDVSEYILLSMLDAFSETEGRLAMLLKTGVVKNVVRDLPNYPYRLGALEALGIDAKEHFGAAVDAALLTGRLGTGEQAPRCRVAGLDAPDAPGRTFGWVEGKFVSDVEQYRASARYDGRSPLEWRQGLKHDCARVMQLEPQPEGGVYENGLGKTVHLEDDLVHPLLKSSDLKRPVPGPARKAVVVPQRRVGQETETRLRAFPKTLAYLQAHREALDGRGSSIYDGKPPFSIFGIGDYAFKPFKVALSGFYKHPTFALVTPERETPVMLDDTCYFLSFERLPDAVISWALLNGQRAQDLLEALTFKDAKRPYTKRLLMRLDLARLYEDTAFDEARRYVEAEGGDRAEIISRRDWQAYGERVCVEEADEQLALF